MTSAEGGAWPRLRGGERSALAGLALAGAACTLAFAAWGCVSVDYVGKTYPPTANVDLYLSADDVQRPYEVIGQARAEVEVMPFASPGQQLQDQLLAEARSRGADGIILGGVTTREVVGTQQSVGQATTKKKGDKKTTQYTTTTTTNTEEKAELRGTLIRYRAAP
jgi:hypothetical protein